MPDKTNAAVPTSHSLSGIVIAWVSEIGIRYLPYSELNQHRDAIARFGSGLKPVLAISRLLD